MTDEPDAPAGSPASRTIHVVVSCTDRKTSAPTASARARQLPAGTVQERIAAWKIALTGAPGATIPAERLYAGDHWQVVRSLSTSVPPELRVQVSVCSAGLGLIGLQTPIPSYAATFAPGHADSVAPAEGSHTSADWWRALSEWDRCGASHRSIHALAEDARRTGSVLVIALSEQYLSAVQYDVASALDILGEALIVLSAGTRPENMARGEKHGRAIAARLLPADARMKPLVGGAMQSLNVRLLRRALSHAPEWIGDPERLFKTFEGWANDVPAQVPYNRSRTSDGDIEAYIRKELHVNPRATHTLLLRAFRSSGHACEQGRFRALFNQVAQTSSRVRSRRPEVQE